MDYSEALKSNGVSGIITAEDIPGENQIGGIIQDEPLLAEEYVHFIGQPIALVVADTILHAKDACKKIKIDFEKLHVITDPREAFEKGELIMPPRVFACGDVENTWKHCDYVIEGTAESGDRSIFISKPKALSLIPWKREVLKLFLLLRDLLRFKELLLKYSDSDE